MTLTPCDELNLFDVRRHSDDVHGARVASHQPPWSSERATGHVERNRRHVHKVKAMQVGSNRS